MKPRNPAVVAQRRRDRRSRALAVVLAGALGAGAPARAQDADPAPDAKPERRIGIANADTKRELIELRAYIKTLLAELEIARQERATLESEREVERSKARQAASSALSNAVEREGAVATERARSEQAIEDSKDKIAALESASRATVSRIAKLEASLQAKDEALEKMTVRATTGEKNLAAARRDLESARAEATRRRSEAEAETAKRRLIEETVKSQEAALASQKTAGSKLSDDLRAAKAALETARTAETRSTAESLSLERQVQDLQITVAARERALETERKAAAESAAAMTKKVDELTASVAAREAQLASEKTRAAQEHEAATKRIAELGASLADREKALAEEKKRSAAGGEAQKRIDALTAVVAEREKALASEKKAAAEAAAQAKAHVDQLTTALADERRNVAQAAASERKVGELTAAVAQRDKAVAERDKALADASANAKKRVDDLAAALADRETALMAEKRKAEETAGEIASLRDTVQEERKNGGRIRIEADALVARVEGLQKTLAERDAELSQRSTQRDAEIASLKSDAKKLETSLGQARDAEGKAAAEAKELRTERTRLREQIAGLERANREALSLREKDVAERAVEIGELKKQLSAAKVESDRKVGELASTARDLETARDQADALRAQAATAAKKTGVLEDALGGLRKDIESRKLALEKQATEIRARDAVAQTDLDKLQTRAQSLETALGKEREERELVLGLAHRLEDARDQARRDLADATKTRDETIHRQEEALAARQRELAKLTSTLESERTSAKRQGDELERRIREAETGRNESRERLADLESEVASKQSAASAEIARLARDLKTAEEGRKSLEKALAEARRSNDELAKGVSKAKDAGTRVAALEKEMRQKDAAGDASDAEELRRSRDALAAELALLRKAAEATRPATTPGAGAQGTIAGEDAAELRRQLELERERRTTLEAEMMRLSTKTDTADKSNAVWKELQRARAEILVLSDRLAAEQLSREATLADIQHQGGDASPGADAKTAMQRLLAVADERKQEAERLRAELATASESIVDLRGRLEANTSPEAEASALAGLQEQNRVLRAQLTSAEESLVKLEGQAALAKRLAEIVYSGEKKP